MSDSCQWLLCSQNQAASSRYHQVLSSHTQLLTRRHAPAILKHHKSTESPCSEPNLSPRAAAAPEQLQPHSMSPGRWMLL